MGEGSGELRSHTLSNGLVLLGEVNPRADTAAVGFFVKTGSRDETAKEAGVSHFLEHMMFKGTPNRTSLDITYELGNIAARANAFTSEECTVYYGGIVPSFFTRMHHLLCDMLRPSLDKDEYAMEKKVILEEIALYLDKPGFFLREKAQEDFFRGHTAGNSVLGSRESITALSRDEMDSYFKRRYVPSNMVLAAAGKFDWDRFIADSEELCGGWQTGSAPRETPRHAPTSGGLILHRPNLKQSHLVLMCPSASVQDDERASLALLASLLNDSSVEGAYWKLVHTGIAESAWADLSERDGCGYFELGLCVEPEMLEQAREILLEVVKSPIKLDEADLERAKTRTISRMVLNDELPMGRMMDLGLTYLARGRMRTLDEAIQEIASVTVPSIRAALERYPLQGWLEYRLLPEM